MPDHHRDPVGQLTAAELDRYASQLARCLKTLQTSAPIRGHVQHELATARAEQDARASSGPGDPPRRYDASGLTAGELDRTRRELAASLALARPDSSSRADAAARWRQRGRAGSGGWLRTGLCLRKGDDSPDECDQPRAWSRSTTSSRRSPGSDPAAGVLPPRVLRPRLRYHPDPADPHAAGDRSADHIEVITPLIRPGVAGRLPPGEALMPAGSQESRISKRITDCRVLASSSAKLCWPGPCPPCSYPSRASRPSWDRHPANGGLRASSPA